MAEEKKAEKGSEKKSEKTEELVYTIPLGKVYETKPRYRRGAKAIREIREFLKRHTKASDVKISKELNELVNARGPKKPPRRVQIKAKKDAKGIVTASPLK